MKSIILCKREGDKIAEEAEWIKAAEIRYIKTEYSKKKGTYKVYGTDKGEYLECNSIEKTFALFEEIDGFVRADRGVMANLNKIPDLDEKFQLLVYDENDKVTIAPARFSFVKDCLKKVLGSFR
ncbi:LytTR family transcriptional regulator DNA-binding domain-containing protein [Paenibacillus odorifer]|uniref:LytTR family transcriptional regulator DNA-binding domain-containing protein n=1 Tax=Paenibacillus odorifer TaxID=189426 RepID=UPI00096D3EA5|nr:LytTR family transcriptional regulator DNA-binding domain-containing protein [Paenibacillus odorifer]OMD66780.1 hypothetical protein BSK50_30660 [Paenibacillus odorifer]